MKWSQILPKYITLWNSKCAQWWVHLDSPLAAHSQASGLKVHNTWCFPTIFWSLPPFIVLNSNFVYFADDSHFRSFPFSPGIQGVTNNHDASQVPKSGPPALEPRDEVLKPQFRSRSSEQWNGQDQILDERYCLYVTGFELVLLYNFCLIHQLWSFFCRLNNEGLGSVIQDLRPSNEVYRRNDSLFNGFSSIFGNGIFGHESPSNGLFGNIHGPHSESGISSSTVTIHYHNVNGHKSVVKTIRHPDGVS